MAVRSFQPVASIGELLARSKAIAGDRAGKGQTSPEAVSADAGGEIGAECGWLARQLRTSGKRLIGLLPASSQTDVLGLAATVGGALTMIIHDVVIIADPDQRSVTGELPSGAAVACSFVSARLITIVPVERPREGARITAVKTLLELVGQTNDVAAVLLDLSSFVLPGELLGVIGMVEGIVIVGRAGRVTDAELLSASRRVPAEMNLGVVLTD